MVDKFKVPKGSVIQYGGCALQLTKSIHVSCENMSVIIDNAKVSNLESDQKENQTELDLQIKKFIKD